MPHLTETQAVILLVVSAVWAVVGYLLSEYDRRNLGRTPWGLPSAVWALFWFLSLIVGPVLYLIAHSSAVRRAHQMPPMSGSPLTGPPGGPDFAETRALTVAEQFPAYPQPANSRPAETDQGLAVPRTGVEGESLVSPTEVTQSWPHSPPAWHPDPSGRFHFRWWDGSEWTSQVSTDGHHLIDTNPDQRIGPY